MKQPFSLIRRCSQLTAHPLISGQSQPNVVSLFFIDHKADNQENQTARGLVQIIHRKTKSFRCCHSQAAAQRLSSETMAEQNPVVSKERMIIPNKNGEKLVGVLHSTGSKEVVVLCHGFRSKKETKVIMKLVDAITNQGISAFNFDFSGNGESEGEFQYGNYRKEAEDLHAVIQCLSSMHEISAILGHSKGGDVALLYASIYHDVHRVINASGRFDLANGINDRFGSNFMERIKKDGFFDVKNKRGNIEYRVTEASLMERLGTDMRAAARSIDKECRVLTVHGSADEIIPVGDALEFAKLIPNHQLHIVKGANHRYTKHLDELASVVVGFLKSSQVGESISSADA